LHGNLAEHLLQSRLHTRHTRGSADDFTRVHVRNAFAGLHQRVVHNSGDARVDVGFAKSLERL
jgi:hypothetical protein